MTIENRAASAVLHFWVLTVLIFLQLTCPQISSGFITERISDAPMHGSEGNGDASSATLSGDGSVAVFASQADNLTAQASPGIFVRTIASRVVIFVAGGSQPSMSSDGQWLGYVGDDGQIYLREVAYNGSVIQASGGLAGDRAGHPSVSADGRYIVFYANAAPGQITDIYRYDRVSDVLEIVSRSTNMASGSDGDCSNPRISSNGRYVSFLSQGGNQVIDVAAGVPRVYIRDLQTTAQNKTRIVSKTDQGVASSGPCSPPAISGETPRVRVAFSCQENLLGSETNSFADTYLYDHDSGQVFMVSDPTNISDGDSSLTAAPALSLDAGRVAFISAASTLAGDDRNGVADAYVRNMDTGGIELVSRASDTSQANAATTELALAGDGGSLVFQTTASDLVLGDDNGKADIFLWDEDGLYNDPASMGHAAALSSGFGTTTGTADSETGINKATLNLAIRQHLFRMRTLGPVIDLTLYYNARETMSLGGFGRGWTLENDMRIVRGKENDEVILVKGDGSEVTFTSPGGEDLRQELDFEAYPLQLVPPPGVLDTLTIEAGSVASSWSAWTYHAKEKRLDYWLMDVGLGVRLERIQDDRGNGVFYNRASEYDDFYNLVRAPLVEIVVSHWRDDCPAESGCPDQRAIKFYYGEPTPEREYGEELHVSRIELPENDGRTILLTHNQAGDLISITDKGGELRSFEYDAEGYMTRKTMDDKDVQWSWVSRGGGGGKRIATASQGGRTTTFTATASGVKEISPAGRTTSFSVQNGKVSGVLTPEGHSLGVTYANGQVVAVNSFSGVSSTIAYDGDGRPTQLVAGANTAKPKTSTFSYDENGNLKTLNSGGATRTFAYSAENIPLSVTRMATGEPTRTKTFTYDSRGIVTREDDSAGGTREFTYDDYGNVLTIKDGSDGIISFSYDQYFRCDRITDQNGNSKSLSYDSNDRLLAITQESATGNPVVSYHYDGQLVDSVTDENGHTTSYERNQFGNITRKIFPLGNQIIFGYDDDNRNTAITNDLGETVTNAFDGDGNVLSSRDALGRIVRKTYDGDGNVLTHEDPSGNLTSFAYDRKGGMTWVGYPDGGATTYERDEESRITSITNNRGQTTDMTYDSRGNVLTKTYSVGSPGFTYTYDAAGNMTGALSGGDQYSYTYTARKEVASIAYHGQTVSFTYDPVGNMTAVSIPGADDAHYTYDTFNRVTIPGDLINSSDDKLLVIKEKPNRVTRLEFGSEWIRCDYDAAANLVRETRSNGTITDYVYDSNNRLIDIVHTVGNTTLAGLGFRLNGADRIATMEVTGTEIAEPLLVSGTASGEYSHGALTRWDGDPATTDGDGNLTRIGLYDLGEYSADNQLTGIRYNGQWLHFGYGPNGMRLSKETGGDVTLYLYDLSGRLLLELSGSSVIRAVYYHIGNRLAAMRRGGMTYFYHFDHVGNTLALTTAAGEVAARYAYEPYGRVYTVAGTVDNPFTFNGAYGVMDDGNDLFYMKNRYYMAAAGRFMQRDPELFASSLNLYDFAHNNPHSYVDPEGDFIFTALAAASAGYTLYKSYRFFKDNSDRNMRRIKNMENESSIDDMLEAENRRKQHENSSRKEGANTAYSLVKTATEAASGLGNNVLGAAEFANEVYEDVTREEEEEDSWW